MGENSAKCRPILFSAPMVRALATKGQTRRMVKPQPDDAHLMRIVGPSGAVHYTRPKGHRDLAEAANTPGYLVLTCAEWLATQRCPAGQPGDRLWVRETWQALRETSDYETDERDLFEWDRSLYGDASQHLHAECPRGGHRAVLCYAADGEDANPSVLYPTTSIDGRKVLSPAEARWRPSIHMPRWASRTTLEITGVRVERLQDISEADAQAEGIHAHADGCFYPPGDEGPTRPQSTARSAFALLWESIYGGGSWDANPLVWVITFAPVTP